MWHVTGKVYPSFSRPEKKKRKNKFYPLFFFFFSSVSAIIFLPPLFPPKSRLFFTIFLYFIPPITVKSRVPFVPYIIFQYKSRHADKKSRLLFFFFVSLRSWFSSPTRATFFSRVYHFFSFCEFLWIHGEYLNNMKIFWKWNIPRGIIIDINDHDDVGNDKK